MAKVGCMRKLALRTKLKRSVILFAFGRYSGMCLMCFMVATVKFVKIEKNRLLCVWNVWKAWNAEESINASRVPCDVKT